MPQLHDIRDILRTVRQVEIRTRRLVTNALAGAYHSSFKGSGIEFEEVREYTPGDDVRTIDWKVTAKVGRPYVKRYREERELTLMLAVDVSASGLFGSGTRSKRALAAELASVLAFSALKNQDKVGLLLFTDEVEHYIPPKKGRAHILRLIRDILFHEPRRSGTDIAGALDYLNRLLKRRSLCFLLSDFLQGPTGALPSPGDPLLRTLSLTNRRHELIALMLDDPRETRLPDIGLLNLEDAETGEALQLNTHSQRVRARYEAANGLRRDATLKALRQCGIDVLPLSTATPYIHTLRQFFERRRIRR